MRPARRADKQWKFSAADRTSAKLATTTCRRTRRRFRTHGTPDAPWYVVPADNKWFTRLVVAAAVVDALEEMNLAFPVVDRAKRRQIAAARKAL